MSHAMPALLKADNLKLLFMVILAITLAVIVKARFFGQRSVDRPSVTPTRQEAPVTTEDRVIPVRTQVPDVQRHPVSAPGKTETDQPTAPSTLHRDLFAPADSAYDPFQLSRSAQEPIGADDLELRATIMDTGGGFGHHQ